MNSWTTGPQGGAKRQGQVTQGQPAAEGDRPVGKNGQQKEGSRLNVESTLMVMLVASAIVRSSWLEHRKWLLCVWGRNTSLFLLFFAVVIGGLLVVTGLVLACDGSLLGGTPWGAKEFECQGSCN